MNTAGRCDHRCSSPLDVELRRPASESPTSEPSDIVVFMAGLAAALEQAEPDADARAGGEAAVGAGGADGLVEPGAAARLEAGGSATRARRAIRVQVLGRVERGRAADRLEELDVLGAVAVGEALLEVDLLLARERLHGAGLARAPQDRAVDLAGEHPVALLEPRAQHVVDAELARERLDLERQRRRGDDDGVALARGGRRPAPRPPGTARRRAPSASASRPTRPCRRPGGRGTACTPTRMKRSKSARPRPASTPTISSRATSTGDIWRLRQRCCIIAIAE